MNFDQIVRFFLISTCLLLSSQAEDQEAKALRKKSEAGDIKATVALAEMSQLSQNDVEYDPRFIFESYQKGVAANLAAAHYGIAKCYVQATGTDADPKLALHHSQKSADLGHAQGIRYLGNCYLFGRGMDEPDPEKGIALLKKSIVMGNEMAEYTYAYYLTRNLKDPKSNQEGLKVVKSLVKRKHPNGLHLMGTLYHDGKAGLPNDRKLAMKHYRMAAELNNSDGLHEVGSMLLQDKKPQEAIGWLVKAINRGSSDSAWALSKIMKADPDLQETPDQWVSFAEKAAIRGNKWAQDAVAGYYYMDLPENKKDWAKASKFALMAAKQDRCHCWDWLASMYVHGKHGVKKDVRLALKYCENHFEHKHHSASTVAHILLLEDEFNSKRPLRIKGYAALLSSVKRGAKFDKAYLADLAKKTGMNKAEIQEATDLSISGFPKEGTIILK